MAMFVSWVFNSFYDLIYDLTSFTVESLNSIADEILGETLWDIEVNLTLFSDTTILGTSLFGLLTYFFSVFYIVIFIVIVWKIIKRLFNRLFRWGY